MSKQSITTAKATAIKRILAFVYDLFLIIPLMMLAALIWLPFNNGVAIEPGNPLYPFMISTTAILTPILFYTYFWYKGGQTLGMRSWKLRIVNLSGTPLSSKQSATRAVLLILSLTLIAVGFNTAFALNFTVQAIIPLGLALISLFGMCQTFTKRRTSLIDLLTQTRIVQLPKVEKPKK